MSSDDDSAGFSSASDVSDDFDDDRDRDGGGGGGGGGSHGGSGSSPFGSSGPHSRGSGGGSREHYEGPMHGYEQPGQAGRASRERRGSDQSIATDISRESDFGLHGGVQREDIFGRANY